MERSLVWDLDSGLGLHLINGLSSAAGVFSIGVDGLMHYETMPAYVMLEAEGEVP